MALPKFDKSQRRKNYEQLPKGAYVVKIMGAVQEPNRNGKGEHVKIIVDIAEGDFKGYFSRIYEANTNEDKKWPNDGTFYLTVPNDDSPGFVWTNYASFLSDLEDSNPGYSFNQSIEGFRNKIIGGKFALEQSEYNGKVYNHVRMRWTCVAEDVRNGKPGKMPNDKFISGSGTTVKTDDEGFMEVSDGLAEELPF